MNKLAIFGGTPVRKEKIFYGCQWIDDDDVQAVAETLKGPYITCGPKVEQFERLLENYTGAKHHITYRL